MFDYLKKYLRNIQDGNFGSEEHWPLFVGLVVPTSKVPLGRKKEGNREKICCPSWGVTTRSGWISVCHLIRIHNPNKQRAFHVSYLFLSVYLSIYIWAMSRPMKYVKIVVDKIICQSLFVKSVNKLYIFICLSDVFLKWYELCILAVMKLKLCTHLHQNITGRNIY